MKNLHDAVPARLRGAHAENSATLIPHLAATLRAGDVVTVKGSLGSKMKPIVEAIVALGRAEGAALMLYHLLTPLADEFGPLNLFRYITFRSGGALLTALLISFLFGTRVIARLRSRQQMGQPIRDDGPETHFDQEGHAHHGRVPDPAGAVGRHAAVGRSDQPLSSGSRCWSRSASA